MEIGIRGWKMGNCHVIYSWVPKRRMGLRVAAVKSSIISELSHIITDLPPFNTIIEWGRRGGIDLWTSHVTWLGWKKGGGG